MKPLDKIKIVFIFHWKLVNIICISNGLADTVLANQKV